MMPHHPQAMPPPHPGMAPPPPHMAPQARQHAPMAVRSQPPHPQAAAYYGQHPGAPPVHPAARGAPPPPPPQHPQKRFKPGPAQPHPAMVHGERVMTLDEEEDTSRGDLMDHLTPREIAEQRYKQHHEWMEEVLGSAYSIQRITPTDLGLGLWGELEIVTKGLLGEPVVRIQPSASAPHGLSLGQPQQQQEKMSQKDVVNAFRPRVEAKIREMEEEMRVMEEKHRQRLRKIEKTAIFRDAERELRTAGVTTLVDGFPSVAAADTNEASAAATVAPSSPSAMNDDPASPVIPASSPPAPINISRRPISEITAAVESATGRTIVSLSPVTRYELPTEEITKMGVTISTPHERDSGADTAMTNGDDDAFNNIDIPTPAGGTAGEMLDEFAAARDEENPDLDDGGVMEDTIMADFMVDDLGGSKPDTPAQGIGNLTPRQQQQHGQQGGTGVGMVDFGGAHADDVLDLQGGDFMADMGGGGNGQQQGQ